jgi:SM-20-related protein
VVQAAVDHYRFLFCTARASEEGEPYPDDAHPLAEIVAFFTGPAFLDFCRAAFARPDIAFADVRATLYQPGHFLHMHTDAQEGKNRVGAYVYNLAPRWRPEWGGALTFPTPDGDIAAAYTPRFNSLNLLQVPQPHYVSYVAPFAGAPRLAITGWVRTG